MTAAGATGSSFYFARKTRRLERSGSPTATRFRTRAGTRRFGSTTCGAARASGRSRGFSTIAAATCGTRRWWRSPCATIRNRRRHWCGRRIKTAAATRGGGRCSRRRKRRPRREGCGLDTLTALCVGAVVESVGAGELCEAPIAWVHRNRQQGGAGSFHRRSPLIEARNISAAMKTIAGRWRSRVTRSG